MTLATTDSIESGLIAALEGLLDTASPTPGPFRQALRIGADPQQSRDRRIPLAPHGKVPALLLAEEGERYAPEAATLAKRPRGFVATSTWRIFVVASELRGDAAAVKGDATTGVYALRDAVVAQVAGLKLPGLYRSGSVTLIESRPLVVQRGEYVWLVRVAAERYVAAAPPAAGTSGATFTGFALDANARPAADADFPNPLAQADADFPDP